MIPKSEMGVIVLFALKAMGAGFEIIKIQSTFPDAIIERDEIRYRAEFEYRASGFYQHKHDYNGCDVIICWRNDMRDCPLPILELSKEGWEKQSIPLVHSQLLPLDDIPENLPTPNQWEEHASIGDLKKIRGLKTLREWLGLSLSQIADQTGVSRAAVCNWQRGSNSISQKGLDFLTDMVAKRLSYQAEYSINARITVNRLWRVNAFAACVECGKSFEMKRITSRRCARCIKEKT